MDLIHDPTTPEAPVRRTPTSLAAPLTASLALAAALLAAALPATGRAEPPPPARAPVLNADAPPYLTAAGR